MKITEGTCFASPAGLRAAMTSCKAAFVIDSARSLVREHPSGLASVVDNNIRALVARRRHEDERSNWQDRLAERISQFVGSMRFVYLHLLIYGLWIAVNSGWLPVKPFDPSLVMLAMTASVEAIFVSTFVLITQNRMALQAARRADLDLQISLLAEHEITRLITLVTAMADRMGLQESRNPELSELSRDVAPDKVMDALEEQERAV